MELEFLRLEFCLEGRKSFAGGFGFAGEFTKMATGGWVWFCHPLVFFFSVGMGLFFSFFLLHSSSPFLRSLKLKKGLESLILKFYLYKNFHTSLPKHQNQLYETQFPSLNLSLKNSRCWFAKMFQKHAN